MSEKKRSAQEIIQRCTLALHDPRAMSLVQKGVSPTAAYDLIYGETQDAERAKAARWLAVLRRDYFGEYRSLIHSTLRHVPTDTAQKGKSHEEVVCKGPVESS